MLTVSAIAEKLGLTVAVMGDVTRTVSGCYVSDLLSDVMAHSKENELWITLQTHPNIVAVAAIKGIAALVLTNGRKPEEETARKAAAEKVTILISPDSTFELAGRIYTIMKDSRPA